MATSPRRLAPSPATSLTATASLDRHSAQAILSSFKESDIIAWLRLLRSIESSVKSRPGNGHLSQSQLNALRCLSSLSNNQAEEWLAQRRAQSLVRAKDEQQRESITDNCPSTALSFAGIDASTNETLPLCEHLSPENEHILESDQSQPISPEGAFRSTLPLSGSRYWSTVEDNPQQFTTFDGFRRHENERERYYILLPDGLLEDSPQGPLCALCLLPDPSTKHFEMHKASSYMENPKPSLKRSRKENFKRLLRTHSVPDEHVERLVRKWHFTQKKQAYSCGLCINLFNTLLERTNHLARDHYERGQNRDGWDFNILIKGLLLQADISEEFKKRYTMDPSTPISPLAWTSSNSHNLQDRLEMSTEDPGELAQAAFAAADRPNETLGYTDVATAADRIPNHAISSSSSPVYMSNALASSIFSTAQPMSSPNLHSRFPDPRDNIDSHLIKAEDDLLPFTSWPSFPGEIIPSRPVDATADLQNSQQTRSIRRDRILEEQAFREPLERSKFQDDATENQEEQTYSPLGLANSSFISQDMTPSNALWEQETWHENVAWPGTSYEDSTYITTTDPSIGSSTLKRKHSPNAPGPSSSRSFAMPPAQTFPPSNHYQPRYEHR